jgi:hypothetical protein
MTARGFASTSRNGNRSSRARGHGSRRVRKSGLKRKQIAAAGEHVYGVPVPEGLHDAIEIERDNLSKAESLLGCLAISMQHETDSVTGPYYPDVAQLARDLVRQSINGLDSLALQKYLLRNKIKEDSRRPAVERGCAVTRECDSNETGARLYGPSVIERDTFFCQSTMADLSIVMRPAA